MADERGRVTAPAQQATATGEKHGRDLQKVNEKLRALIDSLKTEKERLSEGRAPPSAAGPARPERVVPAATPAPYVDDAAALERKRLQAELALAQEAVEHVTAERTRLRERLAEIEAENQRMCDEYVAVESKSSELAQLYCALDRIHGGLTRDEVLTAVQEVVINVVGTEELAILEVRGERLELLQSFGVDPEPLRSIPVGQGVIGGVVKTGAPYVAGRGPTPGGFEGDLTACIPLRVGDRVVGAVAIFRLLGHKPVLGETDQAVFELLSSHAGLALHLRAPARA